MRGRLHRRPPARRRSGRTHRRAGAHEGAGRLRPRHGRWPPARHAAARPGIGARGVDDGGGCRAVRAVAALPVSRAVRRDDGVRGAAAGRLQRVPRRSARVRACVEQRPQGARFVNQGRGFDPHLGPTPGRRDPGQRRIIAIAAVATLGLLVIIGQLWYLQVLEGGRFLDASDKNRIRVRPIAAPRGILFDRNGVPLVDNRPAFTLSIIPREVDNRDAVLGRLSTLLGLPYQELVDAVGRVSADSFLPVRIRRGLTMDDVAKVEEWKLELPGVIVEVEPQRAYPTSRFAAHLLGYVREANDEQMKQGRYRRGELVGQTGLERLLDEFLRGRDGGERIEVDALGRPIRLVQQTDPHPGAQVITTIDRRIQEAAEQALEGRAGAIVVMDPRNGDVLAMASAPAFPIDRFTGTIDRDAWLAVVRDPDFPMLNRTLQTQYAPGSVFKIVVAAAGLQEGTLMPPDRVHCNGE